jgi:Beta protein
MSNAAIYVPILKGKRGDLTGVGSISTGTRQLIKPLIEAMPLNPKEGITLDRHVFNFCDLIRTHLPLGDVFVDFYGVMPDAFASTGNNAILEGFRLLRAMGRSVTPVFGLERNDELWGELGEIARSLQQGFCFRLSRDDISVAQREETWAQIIQRSSQMGLTAEQVDVLVDLKSVSADELTQVPDQVVGFFYANSHVAAYRSLIVAGSAALRTVGDLERDSSTDIRRQELHLWSTLWRDMPDDVKPVYSDYGVVHPDFSDQGPNNNINAKIRYTAGDQIVYFRGHGLLNPVKDYEQYHALAGRVMSDGRFMGRNYSLGDARIFDCAVRQIRHGVPEHWVTADMNHHVTYTAAQVSRLVQEFATAATDEQARRALATV